PQFVRVSAKITKHRDHLRGVESSARASLSQFCTTMMWSERTLSSSLTARIRSSGATSYCRPEPSCASNGSLTTGRGTSERRSGCVVIVVTMNVVRLMKYNRSELFAHRAFVPPSFDTRIRPADKG